MVDPTACAEALEPCPFCGGEAEVLHLEDGENAGGSCVSCKRCLASSNVEFGFKENFVSNWNRRPALDAQARLIEEAREVVLFLANAADEFGVRHLDSDWISPEAEALQKATASARAFLTTLPAKTGETS